MSSGDDGPGAPDLLADARAAYARRDWERAFTQLRDIDAASPLACEDVERLAWAAAMAGRDDDMIAALERAYQLCVDDEDWMRAAQAAFWVGFCLMGIGSHARGSGWITRAHRLVDQAGIECVQQGWLAVQGAMKNLATGDDAEAEAAAQHAAGVGTRFRDDDLVAFARNLQARALIRQGKIAEGLALLDELMITVATDELSPLLTGIICCSAIATTQQIYAIDRAREWTTTLTGWIDALPEPNTFSGTCLVHRAELLHLGGEWSRALDEVRTARERLTPSDRDSLASSHYLHGEIHRMRGDLDAAEASFRDMTDAGGQPYPGLALLRLAQGRVDEAAAAIRRVLDTTRPSWQRAKYLPAYVEIMLAAGDRDAAAAASAELDDLAERFDVETLAAMAAHARALLLLAGGDAHAAVEPLREAFAVWNRLGAPYVAATIRVLLGRAYAALGDSDGAQQELDAARRVFDSLGATLDRAALDDPGDAPAAQPPAHDLSKREVEVLQLIADGKTNKEIAAELGVSGHTIHRHVSNIFTKLGVSTRTAAAAWAFEHGVAAPRRP